MKTVNTYYSDKNELISFLKLHNIDNSKAVLVQVFTGVINKEYIQTVLDNILEVLPDCTLIGSTTDGEILDSNVSITQTVLSFSIFDNTTLLGSYVSYDDSNLEKQAQVLSNSIAQNDSKLIITFVDGLYTNGEKFLNNLFLENKGVYIAGGLAADNAIFEQTYLFFQNKILSHAAVAVSFAGDLEVYTGFNFNWKPIGKELTITKAVDNKVYTIDDKTAYETYKYYLGEDVAKRLPAIGIEFPFILQKEGIPVARAVTGVEKDGSLKFAGDFNEGEKVRFGYGNSELILNSASSIPNDLLKFKPESTFIYSCMARRRFMNHLIEKEIDPIAKLSPTAGFFTYGEFFTQQSANPQMLNQTMTVVSLKEKDHQQKFVETQSHAHSNHDDLHTVSLKALSHLINVTSNELETINQNLQSSIQREQRIISQQKKRIEAQTKMAQLGDMLGHITHQWRQPLSTITTAITSIQVQKELGILKDEYFEKGVDSIVKNAYYLSDTVKVFRDFLKEDKNKSTTSVQSILKMAIEISKSMLDDYHIKLIDNVNYEENYFVNLVSGELIQVLVNIFNNAKDAIVEKKIKEAFVKIDCKKTADHTLIFIEDNGGGIDKNIIKDIFDLYFTTKKQSDGTGLGLHMCQQIVQNHMDGKITVQNTQNGALFIVELPLKRVDSK